MSFWSIAQTQIQREHIAEENLDRAGFEPYLPRTWSSRPVPLFPSYIFVRIETTWYQVGSTAGVIRLLRFGEQPAKIPDSVIDDLRKREVRGFVRLPQPPPRIKAGDKVQIPEGPFKHHIGVYQGMGTRERQRVLLEFLGRQVEVELTGKMLHLAQS